MNQWHYAGTDGSQKGPINDEELKSLVESGEIVGTTLVWKAGMPDWVPYSSVQSGFTPAPPATPANPYATPSQPTQASPGMSKPDNYLVQSILATLFCCLPFGIVAIVFASQVDSKWNGGDFYGAKQASDSAKTWTNVSVILGLAFIVLYIFGAVVVGG